jgi:hypothetical protein
MGRSSSDGSGAKFGDELADPLWPIAADHCDADSCLSMARAALDPVASTRRIHVQARTIERAVDQPG